MFLNDMADVLPEERRVCVSSGDFPQLLRRETTLQGCISCCAFDLPSVPQGESRMWWRVLQQSYGFVVLIKSGPQPTPAQVSFREFKALLFSGGDLLA